MRSAWSGQHVKRGEKFVCVKVSHFHTISANKQNSAKTCRLRVCHQRTPQDSSRWTHWKRKALSYAKSPSKALCCAHVSCLTPRRRNAIVRNTVRRTEFWGLPEPQLWPTLNANGENSETAQSVQHGFQLGSEKRKARPDD